MPRRRRFSTPVGLNNAIFLVLLSAVGMSRPSAGQSFDSSPQGREKLQAEILDDYAAIQRYSNLLKKVARYVRPSVVHIEAEKDNSGSASNRRVPVEEAGSGVIVSFNGKFYVLTNRHVITASSLNAIDVKLSDGRIVRPSKRWEDKETDVAVLAISADGLIAGKIGDSDDVEIGDFVLAVGSPFGLSQSVTYGIISAKGRRNLKLGTTGMKYQEFFQTDAAINPGNSGGPLINLRGEVIGINTAIASASGGNEGIGFTIPSNMFATVAQQLVEFGKARRAFLGVHLNSRFSHEQASALGLPSPRGAHITGITPNSPASRMKLQIDDVIIRFQNSPIEDDSHLVNLVGLTPLGKEVSLVVLREGKKVIIRGKVADRADFAVN
jgi:serine protease Do